MASEQKHFLLDKMGIAVSFLCVIHCFIPPLLVLAFPMIASLGALDIWIHVILTALIIPIAYTAIARGYGHHKNQIVPIMAGLGLAVFILSIFLALSEGHDHHSHHEIELKNLLIAAAGSLLLSSAHAMNMWLCRSVKCS